MGQWHGAVESLAVIPDFWRNKRVLLTGHTGFKGGWLSLWLKSLGAHVTGYALHPQTDPSLFVAARVGESMQSIIADVRDLSRLTRAMQATRPEIVIHMAAQSLVRPSYQNPVETYATNVLGTVHLLESVRQTPGVKAVLIVTTDKCYENREWVWGYRESDPMGGYDPYSSSKGCAELISAAFRSSFFNPADYDRHGVAVATARAGNVIGGGDWSQDRLIPDILAAFKATQPALIRNPTAFRPWQHVLEPLRGYLTLAEHLHRYGPDFAEAWNFGPADEGAKSVGWVVEQMSALWGQGARWQVQGGEHLHEASYLKLDISKARSRLNWHPVLSLQQALQLTVDWSQAIEAQQDMQLQTIAQIQAYQALSAN